MKIKIGNSEIAAGSKIVYRGSEGYLSAGTVKSYRPQTDTLTVDCHGLTEHVPLPSVIEVMGA